MMMMMMKKKNDDEKSTELEELCTWTSDMCAIVPPETHQGVLFPTGIL